MLKFIQIDPGFIFSGETIMTLKRVISHRLLLIGLALLSVLTVSDIVSHLVEPCNGRLYPISSYTGKTIFEIFIITGQFLLFMGAWSLLIRRQTDERAISTLNEELKHKAKELEESNHDLEAFSYSVSHDLRSHLARINGFSQLILEDHITQLPEVCREYFDRVVTAGQEMDEVLEALLSLSRLGRTHLEMSTVNLSELVQVIMAEKLMAEKERPIDFTIEPGLTAFCDGRLMRIALENLISNALKFTRKRERAQIEFGMQNNADEPIWFLRDNGAGFSPEDVERIFQPFQRVHSEAEFPGNGIGLATVHRIVKLHGGRIWAEGEVDKGACFYFTL